MFRWIREYLEIKNEFKPKCETCDVLRIQLEHANYEKQQLLNQILHPLRTEAPEEPKEDLKPILPKKHLSWPVRRQMLEATDRRAAQLMNDKKIEIKKESIEELEKELKIVQIEREEKKG